MDIQSSDIPSFYRGRSIFVTGATGFLGKVLVEKLLWSCPELDKIYVLIRQKKNKDPRERVCEMLDCPVFDRLRKNKPNLLRKIIPIVGDTTLPEFGISTADFLRLTEEVSIVFHSAATVRFDEPMKIAIDLNVLGTRRLLHLCKKMPNVEAVIYVGTAFSNLTRKTIEEKIYPSPVHPQKVIDITEWMSPDMLEAITPKLIGGLPNTYTFTKALSEAIVADECGSLPVAIVRPSIVTAAWKEPIPGWISSYGGPAGIFIAVAKCALYSMNIKREKAADVIPVDVTANLLIASAWYTAAFRPNSVMVYNNTSYALNKETWGGVMDSAYIAIRKTFRNTGLLVPTMVTTRSNSLSFYEVLQSNALQLALHKLSSILGGAHTKKMKKKAQDFADQYRYVTTDEWKFTSDNVLMLNSMMSPQDKQIFNIDLKGLNWPTYWEDHVVGVKKYLLKEDDNVEKETKNKLHKAYIVVPPAFILLTFSAWKLSGTDFFNGLKTSLPPLALPWR